MSELIENAEIVINSFSENMLDQFIAYADVSEITMTTYKRNLKQFFKWLSDNAIINPTRQDILNYKKALQDRVKPTTAQNYLVAVKIFFKFTANAGLYPNIAENIKGINIDKTHKKDTLTTEQAKDVINTAKKSNDINSIRNHAILSLMITCGLRVSELISANIGDIRTLNNKTVLYIKGKGQTDKTQFVVLPYETEKAIRNYLNMRDNQDNKQGLFLSHGNKSNGNRLSARTVRHIAKQSMRDVGLDSERLSTHSLRHTAITLSLINNASLQETQQFARHSNINTTLIYSHNLERSNNRCSQLIANSIFNQKYANV